MAEPTWYVGVLASVAGANKHHLTLHNATGSGATLKIYSVVASSAPTAAVVGLAIPLHVARTTAAPTGGTLVTPLAAAVGETALPAQVTSRANATQTTDDAVPFGVGAVTGEETQAPSTSLLYKFSITGQKPVELQPGQGMTVRQGALASAGAIHVVVHFTRV